MTAEQLRRGRGRARWRLAAGGAAVLVLLLSLTGPLTAAQPNQLLNGRVEPGTGDTKTTIAFSVRFSSALGNAPTSVTAVAGNLVIPLALVQGSADNGRYRGTAKLPAGTWPVLFQASAQGNDPALDGPEVTIARAPSPTPKPTPKPTAQPTVVPTQAPPPPSAAPQTTAPRTPRPAPASRSARPSRSPRASARATPGAATETARPTDAAPGVVGTDDDQQLVTILVGGLIAIGALTLIGFLALLRDRRRRTADARLELLPEGAREAAAAPPAAPAAAPPARAPTMWERDFALDQEPIGTVEYSPPPTHEDETT